MRRRSHRPTRPAAVSDARMGGGELAAKGKALVLTLGAELKALDVPPEVPGGTSLAQVSAAAEVVMHGATKLQMLLADGTDVPEEAADAMLQDFHGQIVAFLAYASSALGSQGVTFDACVRDAARLVSNSCANLVSVAAGHADAPTPELVKPALAEVWAACGALKKLPRDGRAPSPRRSCAAPRWSRTSPPSSPRSAPAPTPTPPTTKRAPISRRTRTT